MKNKRSNKALWSLIFLVIAAVTVWAVASQNRNFSFSEFAAFVADSNPVYIICAVLCMLGFIFFEGLALITICRSFGYKKSIGKGIMYSATDIYFSAITPSASGGDLRYSSRILRFVSGSFIFLTMNMRINCRNSIKPFFT